MIWKEGFKGYWTSEQETKIRISGFLSSWINNEIREQVEEESKHLNKKITTLQKQIGGFELMLKTYETQNDVKSATIGIQL